MNNRYLSRAKRTDNGEWVDGSLLDGEYIATVTDTNGSFDSVVELICHAYRIDPDTIEPVRVPVKRETTLVGDYRCPNCNAAFIDRAGTTPFCGNCGQALCWDAAITTERTDNDE